MFEETSMVLGGRIPDTKVKNMSVADKLYTVYDPRFRYTHFDQVLNYLN